MGYDNNLVLYNKVDWSILMILPDLESDQSFVSKLGQELGHAMLTILLKRKQNDTDWMWKILQDINMQTLFSGYQAMNNKHVDQCKHKIYIHQ